MTSAFSALISARGDRDASATHSRDSVFRSGRMTVTETTARPPLVLLANDQEWSARSLESILGPNGYAVLRAYTGRQVIELVRTALPDLVIVDVRLPDMSGIDVCRQLRDDPRFSAATPLVVTTSGPSERTERLAAYEAGAWEVASQPLDGEALLLKLNAFLRAKREADRLREESLLDTVTGLYNMRGLARRAQEIAAEAQRLHGSMTCVAFTPMADIAAGGSIPDPLQTRLVEHCGSVLRRTGRVSDAIGRLGQAEFAIIAPGTGGAGAVRMVERIREHIEAEPMDLDGEPQRVSIRAGYYAVPDFAASSVDAVEMLLRATTALRHLRSEGREVIRSFDDVPVRP